MKIIQKLKPEFVDDRGGITKILDDGTVIKSVLLIVSKAGAIRSNHYHKKDSHYCYMLSGKAEWSERAVEGRDIETEIIEAGDMVYTPPNTIHAVRFLEDSVLLTLATESRDQEGYEDDTVRIKLI